MLRGAIGDRVRAVLIPKNPVAQCNEVGLSVAKTPGEGGESVPTDPSKSLVCMRIWTVSFIERLTASGRLVEGARFELDQIAPGLIGATVLEIQDRQSSGVPDPVVGCEIAVAPGSLGGELARSADLYSALLQQCIGDEPLSPPQYTTPASLQCGLQGEWIDRRKWNLVGASQPAPRLHPRFRRKLRRCTCATGHNLHPDGVVFPMQNRRRAPELRRICGECSVFPTQSCFVLVDLFDDLAHRPTPDLDRRVWCDAMHERGRGGTRELFSKRHVDWNRGRQCMIQMQEQAWM